MQDAVAERLLGLEVVSAIPTPNYALTSDEHDNRQLVDGRTHRFPPWTKRESVGWKDASYLEVTVRVPDLVASECTSARLRVVSSQKRNAGVIVPRRIDVYSRDGGGTTSRHIGAWTSAEIPDDWVGEVSIDIAIELTTNGVVLAVHSGGRFIMIDELELRSTGTCQPGRTSAYSGGIPLSEIRADSVERLKSQLSIGEGEEAAGFSRDALDLQSVDPFSDNPDAEQAALSGAGSMRRWYVAGEPVFLLVRVRGDCPSDGYAVHIETDLPDPESASLFEVGRVVSFGGNVRLDPLVPLANARLPCTSGASSYLWVSVTPAAPAPANVGLSIQVSPAAGRALAIEYTLSRLPVATDSAHCTPRAVTWGYSTDFPVWRDKTRAMRYLLHGGANVHVLPPSLLPRVDAYQRPRPLDLLELVREMTEARRINSEVKFLLFAAFPRWLKQNADLGVSEQIRMLTEWSHDLARGLRAQDVDPHQWYLYPFDEPTAADVKFLARFARALKERGPEIQLYANPINTHSIRFDRSDLRMLQADFDILQPNMRLGVTHNETFNEGAWWVYHNPPSPAKDAPPQFYRGIGVAAWALGAEGAGFWSFSDTGKSSAWDDFDGRRPDWSVTYESVDGPRGSRRWDAFRQGLADYRLLCTLTRSKDEAINPSAFPALSVPGELAADPRKSSLLVRRLREALARRVGPSKSASKESW